MNSTNLGSTDVPDNPQGQSINSFGYGLGLSVGVVLFIIMLTYASYVCTRMRLPSTAAGYPSFHRRSSVYTTTTTDSDISVAVGLDEATLLTYPTLLYSQVKLHNRDSTAASGCSICLADYKDTDMLRLLPECGHFFHLRCIDPWLKLNPTCPICRNSPALTPITTPVAEVLPLRTLQN